MLKIKSLLLFLLVFQIGYAQNDINQVDGKGQKQGFWQKQQANGNLLYEGHFKNDEPIGEFKRYHPNGMLKARLIYSETSDTIEAELFDIHGKLMAKGKYLGQLKIGKWQYFQKGQLVSEEVFENNQKHGISLDDLDFIQFSELTKPGLVLKSTRNKFEVERQLSETDPAVYGSSIHQLTLFNGQFLHEHNYLGEGIQIAVLDAGFYKADELPAFAAMRAENRILGTRDFAEPSGNVYQKHEHGTNVLSTMGGELTGQLIGTAPKASYYLLRSEDDFSEFLIEEDNWVAAAEYADSLGCDIINSSLGYAFFDDENMDHTYADMDGQTTRVTRAANMAAQKGMLVFASAGNEAANDWKYMVAPSDGDLVIGVGAVNKDSIWAPFSSLGPTSDGDVKPNLAAIGWGTIIQDDDGAVKPANGTSFSSPVLAGMAACLWEANPQASNFEIKEALDGKRFMKRDFYTGNVIFLSNLTNLPSGLIIARIESETTSSVVKLIRINPKD